MIEKEVNFHESFEKDLGHLSERAKELKEKEKFKEFPDEKIVKESIRHKAKTYEEDEVRPEEKTVRGQDFFPSYLSDGDVPDEVKLMVENLVALAFKEGIEVAINESRKYPYFIQDAFHDALAVKVLPEMKKRGLI